MMSYVIEVLRQEHCNIESLLCVLEQELNVFDRGDRPNYRARARCYRLLQGLPDSCHHPKEDMIFEALKDESTTHVHSIAKKPRKRILIFVKKGGAHVPFPRGGSTSPLEQFVVEDAGAIARRTFDSFVSLFRLFRRAPRRQTLIHGAAGM
jgi:hypothetical protein